MNMVTKHEVLQANLKEWLACKGDKRKRGELTNHFAKVLSIHKKSVGRAMKRLQLRDSATQERRGRSVYYGKDVDDALFQIWEEVEERVEQFKNKENHRALEVHKLKGNLEDLYAFSIDRKNRILFEYIGTKNEVALLTIGNHDVS